MNSEYITERSELSARGALRPQHSRSKATLRIANWNLQRAFPVTRRVPAIREHMASISADLWILTETHESISPGDGFFSATSGVPDRESMPGEC